MLFSSRSASTSAIWRLPHKRSVLTSIAEDDEAAFHRTVQLAEIGRFDDSVTFDDYLTDFNRGLHDV